ncbi:dephospho-CoA kinase [Prochlorococcus sp. MIT 1300]|uniref:dephospho-CoA kinase n=1 Tax=Prochlorococcus sp. MIT 1300 TaxID=3096218 RepID=UPI002A757041|nr:dephospho-CoA kinase [Prochlorococcus sp. MIT 1300]
MNNPEVQRRIGITGGIASGKSSVANYLAKTYSIPLLDADLFAHEALAPGTEASTKTIRRYGNSILQKTNSFIPEIDRSALSEIIFKDKTERLWLEQLIHPKVEQHLINDLEKYKNYPIVLLMIPLLFEAKFEVFCSEIWLVSCEPKQQLERLIHRNKITSEEAQRRINSQWPLEQKKELVDILIDNSNAKEAWINQVKELI